MNYCLTYKGTEMRRRGYEPILHIERPGERYTYCGRKAEWFYGEHALGKTCPTCVRAHAKATGA